MVNLSCPFPGMDPFIEGQRWSDFHARLMTEIARQLGPLVAPNYAVLLEKYVGVALQPDVSVYRHPASAEPLRRSEATPAIADDQVLIEVADVPEPTHIAIRDRAGILVTILEVLSPANKTSAGHDYFLRKRNGILLSHVLWSRLICC